MPARAISAVIAPALAIAALLCMADGALSEEKKSPLPGLLPLRTEACFGRVYDSKHLAQHPKQRVTSFHLSREFTSSPYTEDTSLSAEELRNIDGADGRVMVNAYVRFRDRPGVFSNALSCGKNDEGKVFCGIDCDGGSFNLKASGPSILLENEGFVVVGGCGGSEEDQANSEYVSPGKDDKLFRLDSKPVAACLAERDAHAPTWAKLGEPIRKRLETTEPVCFSRSYDAAHLSGHPKQNVRKIAILKTASKPKTAEDSPIHKLVFRVETKDGSKIEKNAECYPDDYKFFCSFSNGSDVHGEFYLTRAGTDHIMLRDRRGNLSKFFETKLGADDRFFKLQNGAASACAP